MIDFQKFSQFQEQSRLEQKEKKDMETLLSTFKEEIGSQHFSRTITTFQKKKKKKENSKIKLWQYKSQGKKFINKCFLLKV